MTKLTYFGRNSFKIVSQNGKIIYVDPYAGDDYGAPADFILVTHEHDDHNAINKVRLKNNTRIIRPRQMLIDGRYVTYRRFNFSIASVPAANAHHPIDSCVGYILRVDGSTLYFAGDTSKLDSMAELRFYGIDYAFLPCDGYYNMGPTEAGECAKLCGCRIAVPVHSDKDGLFNEENCRNFNFEPKIILQPGQTLKL